MLTKKLNPSFVIYNNQIRCCTNATRLINLVKVMKKEPGRTSFKEEIKLKDLNLFKHPSKSDKQSTTRNLWSQLEQEELKLYNQKPARNGFEEMINWTNEGKLWNYPINNEQGLEHLTEKEKFYDHVFFDDIIERSPNKQPIREFMNDAALGLSMCIIISNDYDFHKVHLT